MKPKELVLELETVSPMYCRGLHCDTPELRVPAFRGQLRYWYRVWHPWALCAPELTSPWTEASVFGGIGPGEGRSPFSMSIELDSNGPRGSFRPEPWDRSRYKQRTQGAGPDAINGIHYFGYGFGLAKNGRSVVHAAVPAGVPFRAVVRLSPASMRDRRREEAVLKGLAASWWLLCHLGGVGARARRGFGSIGLKKWSGSEILQELPLPGVAKSGPEWVSAMRNGLAAVDAWLRRLRPGRAPEWPLGHRHPRLSLESMLLFEAPPGVKSWETAMHDAGSRMAVFRRGCARAERADRQRIPGRVTFGMPAKTGNIEWLPVVPLTRDRSFERDRFASPLHIHIARYPGGYATCWTHLAGPIPGRDGLGVRIARSGGRQSLREAPNTLATFLNELRLGEPNGLWPSPESLHG